MSTPLRFWVTESWSHIRVEWRDAHGLQSADGTDAPEEIRQLAQACLVDRHEHGVEGCTFVGVETREQMLAERCEVCAVATATNSRGECVACARCVYCRELVGDYEPSRADVRLAPWDGSECEECHQEGVRAARRDRADRERAVW